MKKQQLIISLSILFLAGISGYLSVYHSSLLSQSHTYKSRIEKQNFNISQSYQGAAEYYQLIKANRSTGRIDMADVLKAEADIKRLAMKKAGGQNLIWQEMGPSNVGGRTRAILVDKNNSKRVYAGAVSGGLWISDNAAATWKQYKGAMENLNISCIEQAPNGDIYVGTGSSFESPNGTGGSGFIGRGIFKSSDGGENFYQLTSTKPKNGNSSGEEWAMVNALAIDPNNSGRIYAATNQGLRLSVDSGITWTNPLKSNSVAQDVEVASDGTVIVAIGTSSIVLYISPSGDKDTFTSASGGGNKLPPAYRRLELEFAPSDNNYIYAINIGTSKGSTLKGIYRSTDKGQTWNLIQLPIEKYFEPFLSGTNDQGFYDCVLAVYPNNPNKILIGGVELWMWDGNLTEIAVNFGSVQSYNPFYVHSDKHAFEFDPNNPSVLYIGTDGGIFKSINANSKNIEFYPVNKGYNVTQFYGIACSKYGDVIGGTQDNGTIWTSHEKKLNDVTEGFDVRGGDGFDCDISAITDAAFVSIYYSGIARSDNIDFDPFSSDAQVAEFNNNICKKSDDLSGPFHTVARLWETFNDPTSQDSIVFVASKEKNLIDIGTGTATSFTDTLMPKQTAAKIVKGSIIVKAGVMELVDGGNGALTGDGSGAINYSTGIISVKWNKAPGLNQAFYAEYKVEYSANSIVTLSSNTGSVPVNYKLPVALSYEDSIKVQDPIQSLYATYFSCKSDDTLNGIYVTRDAIKFNVEPEWFKLKNSNLIPLCMEFSKNGNHLFVSSNENLYRFSGLNNVYDSTSAASIDPVLIFSTTGQIITGIAIDQSKPENVVITLGNYGNQNHVYLSKKAISANNATEAAFKSIQGDLTAMPVYCALIDVTKSSRLIVGTEYGVYATDNYNASSVSWTDENSTMAYVPVFDIRQQTFLWTEDNYVPNQGVIYIGTHGRGIWKTETLSEIKSYQPKENISAKKDFYTGLNVYPNPMEGMGYIEFYINQSKNATMSIVDIQGKIIKKVHLKNLQKGNNQVAIDSNNLPVGIYFIRIQSEDAYGITKMVVLK